MLEPMDPLAQIIIYEMRFHVSWADWNSLRRSLQMYDAIDDQARAWLSGLSDPTRMMKACGLGFRQRIFIDRRTLPLWNLHFLEPSTVAMFMLAHASEPVNREWVMPGDPVRAVRDQLPRIGVHDARIKINGFAGGAVGSFLRVFRECPAAVVEPLARLGSELGTAVPPPYAPQVEALRAIVRIQDALPENADLRDGQAMRALGAGQVGALLDAVTLLHRADPLKYRNGLLSSVPERLASENPIHLRPLLGKLVEAGFLHPAMIYRGAPPDVIARLEAIARGGPWAKHAAHLLQEAGLRHRRDTKPIHLSDVCYALVERKDLPAPAVHPVHAVLDFDDRCPRCSRQLVVLLDMDLSDPLLNPFAPRDGKALKRLQVPACEQCSSEGFQVFARNDDRGQVQRGSVRLRDCEGNEGPNISPAASEADHKWKRNALTLDPLPREPIAPLTYSLGSGGSSHIGGLPRWAQDPEVPPCPDCNQDMLFLGHVNELDLNGGEAYLYLFWCASCKASAVIPQFT